MANFYLFSETAQQFFRQGELAEEFALYLEACPVCDSRQSKKLFDHDGFHYFTCKSCSFVYTNDRLNEAGSKIWYNSPYYNAALAREIYTNQKEETYYSASLEPLHLKELTDLVRDNFDRTAKIIDVGCSTGSILAFLKNELGFTNLKGIDLNEKAVEFARKNRGLDVELMDITNINQRGDYFDLVINTENIEHVNKLEDYILNISALLNEGGYLLISTPHNDEKAVKLLGLFGDHFCAPNHINYFNQKTITLFLEKYNFEV